MNRVHLVLLWHMHQPQYRDPETEQYVLPWTRLHALKDYFGMVQMMAATPAFHATFNIVPALGIQLEEYASGKFREPWFELAFKNSEQLTREDKTEILARAFQVNHERLMSRWPRFVELFEAAQPASGAQALAMFTVRDWRDLQLLSQLAWMEQSWLEKDVEVSKLANKGKNFTEADKETLKEKQFELLRAVLPAYRAAAASGQVEISTTPFYHPILPLVCDSDIARVSNPGTPLPRRAFRQPEDARSQLRLARAYHERIFGSKPVGLWPSEGSVSDQALAIAEEEGFKWFGTDEGVLGRTLNAGFFREADGFPANSERLYKPWRIQIGGKEITGLFRDHHLSDLIGFVYSRMDAKAAAADLHGRLRSLGERVPGPGPVTVSVFLDGENAWEYYQGNGREFLREFYQRVSDDQDFRALTASEAIAAAGTLGVNHGIFPGSWINANFDVWIGDAEDVAAWELLWDARDAYTRSAQATADGAEGAPTEHDLARAKESLLVAEGSDWCWWYGPEHSTANDAEFDELFRKHLRGVYRALGKDAPDELAKAIKRKPEEATQLVPTAALEVKIDGRESSYFEWLGAGLYAPKQRGGSMHGRVFYLRELRYGFAADRLFLRVDSFPQQIAELSEAEFRIMIGAVDEVLIVLKVRGGSVQGCVVEKGRACLRDVRGLVEAAYDDVLEVAINRSLVEAGAGSAVRAGIALWHAGLPIDVLPADGHLSIQLGIDNYAWEIGAEEVAKKV